MTKFCGDLAVKIASEFLNTFFSHNDSDSSSFLLDSGVL